MIRLTIQKCVITIKKSTKDPFRTRDMKFSSPCCSSVVIIGWVFEFCTEMIRLTIQISEACYNKKAQFEIDSLCIEYGHNLK
jgi:hypothetical protein